MWYTNPFNYEVWLDAETLERIQIRGDIHLFKKRVPSVKGTGPANKIAIFFESGDGGRSNGIGDYIHAMPALSEKAKTHEVHCWCSEFFRPFVEHANCIWHNREDLSIGSVNSLSPEFGWIHSLVHWCIIHDEETYGNPTKDRFQQFADFIGVELPESYSWKEAFGITMGPNAQGPLAIALQSTSRERSYSDALLPITDSAEVFHAATKRPYVIFGGGNAHKEQWMQTEPTIDALIRALLVCSVVVSVDSGLLAIALAFNIPVVCVFGPTDEKTIVHQFSRYRSLTNVTVLRSSVTNSECARPCSLQKERGFGREQKCTSDRSVMVDCMKEISVATIAEHVNSLIHLAYD